MNYPQFIYFLDSLSFPWYCTIVNPSGKCFYLSVSLMNHSFHILFRCTIEYDWAHDFQVACIDLDHTDHFWDEMKCLSVKVHDQER